MVGRKTSLSLSESLVKFGDLGSTYGHVLFQTSQSNKVLLSVSLHVLYEIKVQNTRAVTSEELDMICELMFRTGHGTTEHMCLHLSPFDLESFNIITC